ncbi:MAG: hypothetical protein CME65_03725 [Halobacteriovoraceae bacterium]|nr:hypothetical protein [Halobacteriovoraceae bacterium]|tara:strand:+ start:8587 stop:9126 length:540 start_codon:yes stop_codon:yes gene_type:complete
MQANALAVVLALTITLGFAHAEEMTLKFTHYVDISTQKHECSYSLSFFSEHCAGDINSCDIIYTASPFGSPLFCKEIAHKATHMLSDDLKYSAIFTCKSPLETFRGVSSEKKVLQMSTFQKDLVAQTVLGHKQDFYQKLGSASECEELTRIDSNSSALEIMTSGNNMEVESLDMPLMAR